MSNLDKDACHFCLGLKFGRMLLFHVFAIVLNKIDWIFEWRTRSPEKHKITVAFRIYSNFNKQH